MDILGILIVLFIMYLGWKTWRKNLAKEATFMRDLALRQHWDFIENPDAANFVGIAAVLGIRSVLQVPYEIKGNMYDKDFEMFFIVGFMKTVQPRSLSRLQYVTVLRTSTVLTEPVQLPKNYAMTNWEGSQYVVYAGSTTTEAQVHELLDFLQ